MLTNILSKLPPQASDPSLLLGFETNDDAAVYQISKEQGIVATTDFFMPIVDNPRDYGRIAATNALSDVYAVGGNPIMALAIAGFPMNKMTTEQVQEILAGGSQACADAGVPVAGGHTIDAPEPIYGLAVVGLINPNKIKRNNHAKPGDLLILGKGLGVGILGAAINDDALEKTGYQEMLESTLKLNSIGADLADITDVNAVTDVTGFGLLGHLLEICRGSKLKASIVWDKLPIIPSAISYCKNGYSTGAGSSNWANFEDDITLSQNLDEWQRNILSDPQTSGGLLVSCAREKADEIVSLFKNQNYKYATIIGEMEEGEPRVYVN